MSGAEELVAALGRDMPLTLSAAEAACQVAEKIVYQSFPTSVPLVGINGAQGSGKSTLARLVAEALERFHGRRAAVFSLDDFYLTRADRKQLAWEIHPLCATRGVPGTHDVALLREVIAELREAGPNRRTTIPAFDKLADDQIATKDWPVFTGRPGAILLEGWCVGARVADVAAYAGPPNDLELAEDPRGIWLGWSLASLAYEYEDLWDTLDLLVSIEVPDLETVIESRLEQEIRLAADSDRPRMDRTAVVRFVQHYERYTRAMWAAMPQRADMLFRRNRGFGFTLAKETP
ncbi:MAG: kinase [Candidatus Andeanibacterium colombiense]|uniref:Kinase n=1 Tax=Candidatus Andeanibacterium colombiense TaxID=3121345 RepID=A0AAJ5X2K0_9SPHN|nr:MAG: kinase [Sphingomonadaceae bacterium]